MFNALQLLEKIELGESSSLEFKSSQIITNNVTKSARDDISHEISAFANHKGGMIVFGVSDSGVLEGIDADRLQTLIDIVSEICHDSIVPPIVDFSVEPIQVPDEEGNEKVLVYLDIARSLWTHKSMGKYYVRQGSAKREMSPEQLGRLLQARSQAGIISFDEQAVPSTDKSIFNKDLFRRFLRGAKTEEMEDDQLLKRRLLVVDERDSYRASIAGVLMCSDQPSDYLNNSFVQAVCYSAKAKDANYQVDAKDFKKSLDQQIIDAFQFVKKYNQVSARKDIGRIERPQYSMRAVFEAIVNAVVHRDYSMSKSKIRLFLFSDRLELYSPGALANTITVETLQHNQATRNELLSRLLSEVTISDDMGGQVERAHFLERRGEGVSIILNESEQLSSTPPVYEMFGEELRLTIFAAKSLQEG